MREHRREIYWDVRSQYARLQLVAETTASNGILHFFVKTRILPSRRVAVDSSRCLSNDRNILSRGGISAAGVRFQLSGQYADRLITRLNVAYHFPRVISSSLRRSFIVGEIDYLLIKREIKWANTSAVKLQLKSL